MRRILIPALGAWTASAVLLVACQSTVDPGPTPPLLSHESSLSLEIAGPSRIDAQGTFSWKAFAFGGSGEYRYRWEVTRQAGQQSVTQQATTTSLDRELSLLVTETDGSLVLRLTVTSGNQVKVESFAVRNCIRGCVGL